MISRTVSLVFGRLPLFAVGFVLVGCTSEEKDLDPASSASDRPKTVIGANYAIANLAYQLAGDDFRVVYPIPAGVDPGKWEPSPKEVEAARQVDFLLVSERDRPGWVEKLRGGKVRVVTLPKEKRFDGARSPETSVALLHQIALALTRIEPDSTQVRSNFETLKTRLLEVQKEWPEEKGSTLFLPTGRIRPAQGDFFSVLESNRIELKSRIESEKTEEIAATNLPHYEAVIVPLLDRYCIECHDSDTEEGEVNFDSFLTSASAKMNPDLWESVRAQIELGQMPPHKRKERPDAEEQDQLLSWIEELITSWDEGEMGSDPGRTTIRRLNKNEYNYTIRDLFGLRLRPADQFPEDGGGEAGFDNNADALFLPSLLMENYTEAAGEVVQAVYGNFVARNRYLFVQPGPELKDRAAARTILNRWASLAWRRPVPKPELERLVSLFQGQRAKKKSFEESMKAPLLAILLSPNFLYRTEVEKPGKSAYLVDQFSFASRLSYFLWSSMPDAELFKLASEGRLQDLKVIQAQVDRMLQDPKSDALSMHFAGQWFGWELLRSRANPDAKRYPEFTFALRIAMYKESSEYFQYLISSNGSAYALLDSDFTFLNDTLARHYGIPGVTGREFRKVTLTDRNRGGVLGMGSVLTATSLPLRSSPAVRGSYVLEQILGTPPPNPPMDVEQLPDDDRELKNQTFREALVEHRENESCRSCHELIDPIGFGLESFDAIGRFRTRQNGQPLDVAGTMPDGTEFSSPAQMKANLMKDRELFARNMVSKMLSYALGRELTPYDRQVIENITKEVVKENGSIRTAFSRVALSYPFRYRRNDDYHPQKSKSP
ncbi:MAG: DUF1592 domain-containing protein [Verrucomicrobiales bacterium]|nr:DUF1592 domain-containing protein [Verrucomicrobiales bacterium]